MHGVCCGVHVVCCAIAVPQQKTHTEAFYEIWTPVLERNSRWALSQPMPGLGHKDTPIQDVLDM